jgi:hypothetical protein
MFVADNLKNSVLPRALSDVVADLADLLEDLTIVHGTQRVLLLQFRNQQLQELVHVDVAQIVRFAARAERCLRNGTGGRNAGHGRPPFFHVLVHGTHASCSPSPLAGEG